jgi:hypothetical protein
MRRLMILTSTLALVLAASAAQAQKLDANGRCYDKFGKFAKPEVCKGLKLASPAHFYKLDPKGHCRDEKGRMAKTGLCKPKH